MKLDLSQKCKLGLSHMNKIKQDKTKATEIIHLKVIREAPHDYVNRYRENI